MINRSVYTCLIAWITLTVGDRSQEWIPQLLQTFLHETFTLSLFDYQDCHIESSVLMSSIITSLYFTQLK